MSKISAHAGQLQGFFLIDKPKGISSFFVVKTLRKILGIKRIGFAGTLDPLADGLMIVAIGEATKLLSYLDGADKVYEVEVKFGATSETYDAEGPLHISKQVERATWRNPARALIEKVLEEDFLGERMQQPPIYSALQVDGKRAYALARKGIKLDLKKRKVHFFELQIKKYSWPILTVLVHCSSGTYVRSFAHDLGQILGCGGYVQTLRRTKIGTVSVKKAVELKQVTPLNFSKYLLKPEEFLSDWQQYVLTPASYRHLANGGFEENKSGFKKGPILAIYQDKCVGVLEIIPAGQLKFAKKFNTISL